MGKTAALLQPTGPTSVCAVASSESRKRDISTTEVVVASRQHFRRSRSTLVRARAVVRTCRICRQQGWITARRLCSVKPNKRPFVQTQVVDSHATVTDLRAERCFASVQTPSHVGDHVRGKAKVMSSILEAELRGEEVRNRTAGRQLGWHLL